MQDIEGIDALRDKIELSILIVEDALSQLEEELSTMTPFHPMPKSAPHTRPLDATPAARIPNHGATPRAGTGVGGGSHTGTTPISTSTLPKLTIKTFNGDIMQWTPF